MKILRDNEPIKNDIKKKIIYVLDKLHNGKSAEVKRIMKLFAKYTYSHIELIRMLQDLSVAYFKEQECNFNNYEYHFQRLTRKYRLN